MLAMQAPPRPSHHNTSHLYPTNSNNSSSSSSSSNNNNNNNNNNHNILQYRVKESVNHCHHIVAKHFALILYNLQLAL